MLKVIFKVQKLVLKLKNIECQIVAKKDQHIISLSPLLTISNGQVCIGTETQFLIIQNDPLFLIQVSLNYQGAKKLGGELSLNVAEWDENVNHSTVATLKKSPDRNSQICYTFLYIRKNYLAAQKSLILCSEYRDQNLTQMEGRKRQLTKKQNKLEDQIKRLKQENMILYTNQQVRKDEITCKKRDHDKKIQSYQQTIDINNFRNDFLKRKNEQMVKMIQKYGREQIKQQLNKKYPEKNDEQSDQKINLMQRVFVQSQEDQIRLKNKGSTKNNSARDSSQSSSRGADRQRSRQKRYLRNLRDCDID